MLTAIPGSQRMEYVHHPHQFQILRCVFNHWEYELIDDDHDHEDDNDDNDYNDNEDDEDNEDDDEENEVLMMRNRG